MFKYGLSIDGVELALNGPMRVAKQILYLNKSILSSPTEFFISIFPYLIRLKILLLISVLCLKELYFLSLCFKDMNN